MHFFKTKKVTNDTENEYMEIKTTLIIWSGLISVGFLIFACVCFLWKRHFSLSVQIENDVFGQFGDFVGGVVGTGLTFLSVVLLYYTFLLTKKQICLQQIQNERQQIETRFFELLTMHRKNADRIIALNDSRNLVFKEFVDEIDRNYNTIKKWANLTKSSISIMDIMNISYLAFFYGVQNKEGINTIKDVLLQYNPNFDIKFINDFTHEQINWGDIPSKGHEIELGHYFRQLYQIVKYINTRKKNVLSYKERYMYIKTLRAQMTAYEQIILFWDSVSILGESWEFREKNKNKPNQNLFLITKYNLIKNIPAKFSNPEIKLNHFYPKVKFDWLISLERDESIYY